MTVQKSFDNRTWHFETREQLAESWNTTPAIYDDHTLQIDGHPVMEDWELNYMEKLAEVACSEGGHVLEIGYGLGLSARAIQRHSAILKHTIIECHPGVRERCQRDFAETLASGRLCLLSGFWQDIVPTLADGSVNGILLDMYPLTKEEKVQGRSSFFHEAYRLLKPRGVLTYFSQAEQDFGIEDLDALHKAGFSDIRSEVCDVDPPADCRYWRAKTIIVPIIRKPKDVSTT